MGNCHRKEFDEEFEDFDDLATKNSSVIADMTKNYSAKNPLVEFIEHVVPRVRLHEKIDRFYKRYRIKKNLRCQKDPFYVIKVIENTRSGRFFNLKQISKKEIMEMGQENFKNFFQNEMKFFEKFKHPYVENLVEVYLKSNENDLKLYIITNYVYKKSLLELINDHIRQRTILPEDTVRGIMRTLVGTVCKLRTANIIHRNLGPENIFFQMEGDYKTPTIRNFYFSAILPHSGQLRGAVGGLWTMSPEMVKDFPYDFKSDVWALGVIFYMLITRQNPFHNCFSRETLLDTIKKLRCFRNLKELRRLDYDNDALTLAFKMLREQPNERIATEIILNDNYFSEPSREKVDVIRLFNNFRLTVGEMLELTYKINNLPKLNSIIYYLVHHLKDYFINNSEQIMINELYKSIDKNDDGQISKSEIEEMLFQDIKADYQYVKHFNDLIYALQSNEYRQKVIAEYLWDQLSYDYFVTTMIIIGLFKNKNDEFTQKKLIILFNEIDLDGSGQISISEIQDFFKADFSINMLQTLNKVSQDDYFESDLPKNFNLLDLDQFKNLLFYDYIKLSQEQRKKLQSDESI